MSTPTLSMQIMGQMGYEAARKRARLAASKKAWRTRRRMAKVSPKMLEVMREVFLDRRYLSICYMGKLVGHVAINGINPDGSNFGIGRRIRVTYGTYRAFERRGWLEFHHRRATGTFDSNGRTVVTWELDYRLSDKGREAFHRYEGTS